MSFTHSPIGSTFKYKGIEYMKILDVEVEMAEGALTVRSKRNAVAISGPVKGILVRWTDETGFRHPDMYDHVWRFESRKKGWPRVRWQAARPFIIFYELYKNWNLYKSIILTWWTDCV